MAVGRTRHRAIPDIWPGFVDALAALLIIVIFLLMVFTLAQYFLSEILTGRDRALDRLNGQVAQLSQLLSLERTENANLEASLSQLAAQLAEMTGERDALQQSLAANAAALAAMTGERDALLRSLAASAAALAANRAALAASRASLEDALRTIDSERETVRQHLLRIASLEGEIEERDTRLSALAVRAETLGARAEQAEEALSAEQVISKEAAEQVALLNLQIAALRRRLADLVAALDASESKAKEQNVQIVNLSKRLNEALANKVQELASFRSEFFGRLRRALGNRSDVRIVGDRFVFQSEVLFPSGQATLQPSGREQIAKLAATVQEISVKIPDDINWVLRVDGHTDRLPISTPAYPSTGSCRPRAPLRWSSF